jgi:predicted nucleic acid-binding protein
LAIFVDTSALYALLAVDDASHADASATFGVLGESDELITHGYVVSEVTSLVQRRLGAEALRTLLSEVLQILDVEMVDRATHDAAVASLLAAVDRRISFVDWTSFVFMRARGISEALTYDRDFVAQGFRALRPPQDPGTAISR